MNELEHDPVFSYLKGLLSKSGIQIINAKIEEKKTVKPTQPRKLIFLHLDIGGKKVTRSYNYNRVLREL